MAPSYLMEMCQPLSNVSGRNSLRSTARGDLDVPRTETSTYSLDHAVCSVGANKFEVLDSLHQSFRDATPTLNAD